jgi:glycosyltransferase involved in cell wall biosynthesis
MTVHLLNPALARDQWPPGSGMIYLGMSGWHDMWKSRHQLMSRFAKVMPVVYVEPWVSLNSIRKRRTGLSRVLGDICKPMTSKVGQNLTVLSSSASRPVSGSDLLAAVTQKHWLGGIRRAARAAGITSPILWICRPEMAFSIGQLGEQFSIYHIVDEYRGYTGVTSDERERLAAQEAEVLGKVDLSIAASPELVETKRGPGRDIMLLENGVSSREYESARENSFAPEDMECIPRPRLGYSGLIGKRLNLDLMSEVAEKREDWSIVFIGKVDSRECLAKISHLESLPNVYFLGEKRPADVARYITALDAGLLPYAVNLETEHISPIKMYEYWAAGKPVIGTSIPSTRRNSSAIGIADTASDFIKKVDQSLSSFDQSDRRRLIALASGNSWQSRVDRVSEELLARLNTVSTEIETS